MANVISWPGDLASAAHACARLRAGHVGAIATEAGYEGLAFGLDGAAVAKLARMAMADVPLAIALGSSREVFDWAPHLRGAGLRLARDFWPGPLVIVTSLGLGYGLLPRLPPGVRQHLEQPNGLALRLLPRDDLASLGLGLGGPLVVAPLAAPLTKDIDVVLEVEPIAPTARLTVAAAGERSVRVLREGNLRRDELEACARAKVVFICTGNTCRSPMAEVLCRRLLADTLGIEVNELAQHGYDVESAGMAAVVGEPASPEAVAVAESLGGDLKGHASRPLTMELVDRADHLFTMTAGHLRMLHSLRLPVGPEPQLLSAFGEDVPDPIGGPLELYQACAEQIRRSLRERSPQILEG